MGGVKDRMMQQESLGYSSWNDRSICTKCVEDNALAAVVRSHPEQAMCSFCGKRRKHVGCFDAVLERIAHALYLDYSTPENELFLDKESDTSWAGVVMDIYDVMGDIGYEASNWSVMEAIHSAFSDRRFCDRDYGIMRPTERRVYGWHRFKEAVKHQRRFTFWSMGDESNDFGHPDYMAVGETLEEIGSLVRASDLLKEIGIGTEYWRVRVHEINEPLRFDHELSPPPADRTRQPNRMSPSGIPMFYGAEDYETACAETVDLKRAKKKAVYAGRFRTLKPLRVLDLVNLPKQPSYFDIDRRDERLAVIFLRQFVKDLAEPILRDGREHIEYVPTQAFTEYVRFQLTGSEPQAVHGIRYSSARNRRPCVVLFCSQDQCINEPDGYEVDRWLSFDNRSLRATPASEVQV